jgi:hypothetical protein
MLVAEVLAVDNKPSSISIPERNGTGRAKNDCHLGNEEFKANPAGQYQLLSQRLFRILWAVVFPAVGFLAILLANPRQQTSTCIRWPAASWEEKQHRSEGGRRAEK